jgi:hypothetical protein
MVGIHTSQNSEMMPENKKEHKPNSFHKSKQTHSKSHLTLIPYLLTILHSGKFTLVVNIAENIIKH